MNSKDSMGKAGELCVFISARMMENAIRQGIEAGVKAAVDFMEEEKRSAAKEKTDRQLHDTRLLLKNYRIFKKHVEGAIYKGLQTKSKKETTESAHDILSKLSDYVEDNLYIESIKKSQQRTLIILNHIDQMLRYYRIDCEQNGTAEDVRRYKVIMETYINEPKKSAQEIADTFKIERRTVYKDISAAIKPLTSLIFGIDSLKLS